MGIEATTVYNTADGFLAALPRERAAADRPYILHRGGYLQHRNTERVIQAFRIVRNRVPDVELKIVGAPEGAHRWGTRDEDGIQYLPRLSDAELAACYAGSVCVIAASLAEGFGLPIIEGFGFGTPVITSDIDPMREVAGGAAMLVDPYNIDMMGEAMLSVVSDRSLAGAFVAKGRARLETFSGNRLAEQMMRIYSTCLDQTVTVSELQTSPLR
jgi:glycosyltransferase involved in cell wall biosynthesis